MSVIYGTDSKIYVDMRNKYIHNIKRREDVYVFTTGKHQRLS